MSKIFDTLAAAHRLRTAGMERPHAEAVADVVRDSRSRLATEDGMYALRRELTAHRWVLVLNLAMTMAILAVTLTTALRL